MPAVGQAQNDQIRFEHITSEQGLSENVINCIFQDSRGFLWVGTNDGLNKYDGYQFSVFKPVPGKPSTINSNLIFAITEDQAGNIWIGTTGSGVNRFDSRSETFTYLRHEPTDPNSLAHDHVLSLYTDRQGRIWIGTIQGLNVVLPGRQSGDTATIVRVPVGIGNTALSVQEIFEDRVGNLWIGSTDGLYRCEAKAMNNQFAFRRVEIASDAGNIKALNTDQLGRLIVGTTKGVYCQTRTGLEPEFEKFGSASIQAILHEGQDRLWLGTYQGLMRFRLGEGGELPRLESVHTAQPDNPYSLNKNVVKSLFRDQTGIIWVGTIGGGLNKFDPDRKAFYHFGRDLRSNGNRYTEVRAMLEDSYGNLWIGTEGGGLFWHPRRGEDQGYTTFFPVLTSARVFALEEVEENGRQVLYAGSEDWPTLHRIYISENGPVSTEKVSEAMGPVFSILKDSKGLLWFGTYNKGLWRWIPKAGGGYQKELFTQHSSGLAHNIVRKVYEDTEGHIWIGTAKGLNRIHAAQAVADRPDFQTFRNDPGDTLSLSHDYILDILQSASGYLWVGTFGGGLNQLTQNDERGARFRRYLEQDGLPNNTVKGILEDAAGYLWLAGNGGLARFDPATEQFKVYSKTDGLQSAEFFEGAKLKRSNGNLLFGGVNGFNAFAPENIHGDETPPKVIYTHFSVHNREVKPNEKINGRVILTQSVATTDKITLKYSQNDFSVEFAGLHYADPQKNKYAYQLRGYHDDWIETGPEKRFATFTNLPHGKYALLVRASNPDGLWTEQPAVLHIEIEPPFWLSWPAYLLYLVLISTALWLFRRYTIIGIHEKHRLMLQHLEREKLEELNQMKLRFFTNISHELRTPLTLIISPLELILEKGKSLTAENLQQQYHYMYKNAKYLLRLVNQLLDFRKLDQGSMNLRVDQADIFSFIETITQPFQFLANKQAIGLEVRKPESRIVSFFDPDVVEKVMYNLLSNAFKFTPSGGRIRVEVEERDGGAQQIAGAFVEIRVRDNGVGISKHHLKKIFKRFHKEESKVMNKDGAGIGLAYTKSLVDLHHGTIDVESIKGKGACFIVRLPMEKKAYLKSEIEQGKIEQFTASSDPLEYLVANPVAGLANAPSGIEEAELDLPLLLFVDDNSDIRRFIKEGFQNDFRIIEAEDGEKALEIALASLPDIIVSDVMMPNMDGIELCESLKTNPLTSHIPIVLLTAKSTDEDALQGLRTGADAYVAKPFKLDILRAQLLNIYFHRERLKQRFRQEVLLQPEEITVTSADETFLKRAVSIIEEHMSDSEFNVEALVKEMYLSRSKLYLKLKALTGQSSSEFIRTIRLKRAVQLLEKSDYTIKEIMFMTGFNTASYFSKCFKNQFGVVPSEYLKEQKRPESEKV